MTYQELINDDIPVLVDFSAEWCGPCKAMSPVLKQVAKSIGENAKIIKIDVDKNQQLANQLGVRGVPTFMIYKKGELLWKQSGMQSKTVLETQLKNAM